MKKLNWILAGLTLSAVTFFSVSCNPDELNPDGDKHEELQKPVKESSLTPQQHQEKIDAAGDTFFANINAEDYRPLIETIQKLLLYFETGDLAGEMMQASKQPVNGVSEMMLSTLKGENPSNLTATTTAVAEMIVSIEHLLGSKGMILEFDSETYAWTILPSDKREIKIVWDDAAIVLAYSEKTTNYHFEGTMDGRQDVILDIAVPNEIAIDLTVADQTLMSIEIASGISEDGLTFTPELNVTIVDLSIESRSNANPEFISSEFSISKGGVEFASAYYKVVVPGMTDPANWVIFDMDDNDSEFDVEEALESKIKTGEFFVNIMNIQLRGEGNIRAFIDEMEKFDNSDDMLTDEEEAQKEADIFNEHIKLELLYNDDHTLIAKVIMQPVKSYDNDYYLEPVLLFSDGTTMSIDKFFKNLESDLMKVLAQFAAIFENLDEVI